MTLNLKNVLKYRKCYNERTSNATKGSDDRYRVFIDIKNVKKVKGKKNLVIIKYQRNIFCENKILASTVNSRKCKNLITLLLKKQTVSIEPIEVQTSPNLQNSNFVDHNRLSKTVSVSIY